jgi:hypothetical protein
MPNPSDISKRIGVDTVYHPASPPAARFSSAKTMPRLKEMLNSTKKDTLRASSTNVGRADLVRNADGMR